MDFTGYEYEDYSSGDSFNFDNYSMFYPTSDDEPGSNESMNEDSHNTVFLIHITVSVLSVIGNILVVLISGFYMRLQSLTSIFILNLALSDLLFTVGLLFWIGNYIRGSAFGDATCRVICFALSTGFYTSMMLLVLMNIQHYMVTVHSYSGWKKRRCVTLLIVCMWMVGIMAALPSTVHMVTYYSPGLCMSNSKIAFIASMFEENIFFVCASVIMCFCSIRILQTIIKSPTNQKHRTTVLVLSLAPTFLICCAPYHIVIFLLILGYYGIRLDFGHVLYAMYICIPLAFSRCCINPIIYGLFGLKFRKEFFQRRNTLNSAL